MRSLTLEQQLKIPFFFLSLLLPCWESSLQARLGFGLDFFPNTCNVVAAQEWGVPRGSRAPAPLTTELPAEKDDLCSSEHWRSHEITVYIPPLAI